MSGADQDYGTCPKCGEYHDLIHEDCRLDKLTEKRYRSGDIECIDAVKSALTPEEFRGFCKGNVLKYIWRERYKGKDEDLSKAADYINYLIKKVEKIVDSKD